MTGVQMNATIQVKSYRARDQAEAAKEFAEHAKFMATQGYYPVSQNWEGPSFARTLLLAFFLTAPLGALTVTYRRESRPRM